MPCVDGSGLSRTIERSARLVGAAMCSACLRGAVSWPLALMLSADPVPVKSTRSGALWHEWVVPIRGPTGLGALFVHCPFQLRGREVSRLLLSQPMLAATVLADSFRRATSWPRRCGRSCWPGRQRHVWTAPGCQEQLNDLHGWSELPCVRPVCAALFHGRWP